MEASVANGTPAAADAGGQVQAPGEVQPDAQVQAAPETQPTEPQNDVQAQLKAMEATVAELKGKLDTPQNDFLSDLTGDGSDDLALTPEEIAALQAGQDPAQAEPGDEQAQQAELDAYMKNLVNEAVSPIFQERQMEQLQAFVKDHPDIQEDSIREPVLQTMQALGERYGNEAERDTNLLKLAYSSVKAGLADAGSVPAEQAADHGASIETQAGQTQTGESSVDEQYVNALRDVTSGGDDFS